VSRVFNVSLNPLSIIVVGWFRSFVYGANKGVDRKLLWAGLASMKGRVAANPWMICGDFNVVKSLNEK
jgi:hypothetical protein